MRSTHVVRPRRLQQKETGVEVVEEAGRARSGRAWEIQGGVWIKVQGYQAGGSMMSLTLWKISLETNSILSPWV